MIIRTATIDDSPKLEAIFVHAVTTLAPEYYSPEQVQAWAAPPQDSDRFQHWLQDGRIWVAQEGDRILGFVGLMDDGLVSALFVHGDYGRQGIGSRLLSTAIAWAQQHHLLNLRAEASELSRPLFAKFGFRTDATETVTRGGVVFHRALMSYTMPPLELDAASAPGD